MSWVSEIADDIEHLGATRYCGKVVRCHRLVNGFTLLSVWSPKMPYTFSATMGLYLCHEATKKSACMEDRDFDRAEDGIEWVKSVIEAMGGEA